MGTPQQIIDALRGDMERLVAEVAHNEAKRVRELAELKQKASNEISVLKTLAT